MHTKTPRGRWSSGLSKMNLFTRSWKGNCEMTSSHGEGRVGASALGGIVLFTLDICNNHLLYFGGFFGHTDCNQLPLAHNVVEGRFVVLGYVRGKGRLECGQACRRLDP